MRKRRRTIILITLSIFVLILAASFTAFFLNFDLEIKLNGQDTVQSEIYSDYKDLGAKGYITVPYIGLKIGLETTSTDNVDTNTLGQYNNNYKLAFLGKETEINRKVEVVDTTGPVITSDSDITVDFTDENQVAITDIPIVFTAIDNVDGDVSDTVVKTYDKNGCTLTATDKSGNIGTYIVKFNYKDKQAPTLTLDSELPVYLELGSRYTKLSYTATDNVDGEMTDKVKVSNLPDTSKEGTYNVLYEVTDSSFNTKSFTHKVTVYKKWEKGEQQVVLPTKKTIYLTFDDGPGVYTEYLLRLLNHYEVKATFFVTDQFPKYQSLIKKAYKQGHTIGVHTYSHRFDNIYSSVENYLADFDKIQAIIEKQTGQKAKIFRFPGGTSNTVSQKYATGIMSALVSEMNSRGYTYFDWNYDCGDTSGKKAKQIYNGILNHIDTRFKTEDYTIILLHDIKVETIKAMAKTVEYCLVKGYTFAALDETSPNRQFAVKN